MDINEALKEIQSRVKPYIHVGMPQSTFSGTLDRIRNGQAKHSTIVEFMAKFGYKIKKETQWTKI